MVDRVELRQVRDRFEHAFQKCAGYASVVGVERPNAQIVRMTLPNDAVAGDITSVVKRDLKGKL